MEPYIVSKTINKLNELKYQTYYGRKNGNGFHFNYDLLPLIHNFSFIEFFETIINNDQNGFLVITNNQYIIGYTDSFGIGTHRVAFARVIKDLTGGGFINSYEEANKLSTECCNNFITARITNDYRDNNNFGFPSHTGAIYFKLPGNNTITKDQYEVFKKFYNEYAKELSILIRKYGIQKFNIQYEYLNEEGTKIIKTTDNLDELYVYLETLIDDNKILSIDNEIIIGETFIPNKKTKKLK